MKIRTGLRNKQNEWRTGWRILAFIVLVVVAGLVINIGWRAIGMPGRSAGGPWFFLLFATLIGASMVGIIVLLLRLFEKRGLAAIGLPFDRSAVTATVVGTALGATPILLLVGLALFAGYGSVAPGNLTVAGFLQAMLPMLLAGFLLAGWEELALRGYLLRQFSLGLNPVAAVIITGLLFGVMHSGNPGANWEGLVYTALGGILMGWLMVRSGSLWLLVGYHFGWNATAYQLFGLELSGFETESSATVVSLAGSEWLTGGSYGFEASLPAVVFEVLVLGLFTSRRYGLRSAPRAMPSAEQNSR